MSKLFVLIFAVLLSACNAPTPVFEKIADDAVILAFGDSLTYGTGASKHADYPYILSTLSSHRVINAGIPGEISKAGLTRLPRLLEQHQPELLILIHGGNDLLRRISPQQTLVNIEQMVMLAKQGDIKVVMLGVPELSLFLLESAEIYQQIADQQNIPVDLDTLPEILSNKSLKSDTIHPNDQGYQLMAEKIYDLLLSTGAL